MLIEWGEPRGLGVPESTARLNFTEEQARLPGLRARPRADRVPSTD
ncbi:hypothetical protein [Streptomyces sp. Tu 6176]|nr:hypothetical protein [Streptomyces sp. Tu 6176]